MAVDRLVDSTQLDADLTSVANAIRTKGGTSASLSFPSGFVDAIDAIETGGGGTSVNDVLSDMAKKQLTGDIVLSSSVTANPSQYFMNGQKIKSFRADGLTGLASYSFMDCVNLETINFPNLQNLYAAQCFKGCTKLKLACFPKLGTGSVAYFYSATFQGCTALETADLNILGDASRGIVNADFSGCTNFKTLILRKTDGICPLSNINAFQNSPFASGGSGGTVYVPQALISTYQAATNWSTILGYANNSIQAIEGSIYETQYADGTPIT